MMAYGPVKEKARGSSSVVVGVPLAVNRRFAMHKARQQTNLLHISAQHSAKWTRHIRHSTQNNGILRIFSNKVKKSKVVPMLNLLSTMPWRCIGEWMYRPKFLHLDTRWRWVVSFTPGERGPCIQWIGGWVLTLPGLKLRPLGRPARSQSPYRLRYLGSDVEKKYYNLCHQRNLNI
jgi:hypothetical protein